MTNGLQTENVYVASKVEPYLEGLGTHTTVIFLLAKNNKNVTFYVPLFFLALLCLRVLLPLLRLPKKNNKKTVVVHKLKIPVKGTLLLGDAGPFKACVPYERFKIRNVVRGFMLL